MVYFLLKYYENVYFNINGIDFINYYNCYFYNDPLFNKRIFIKSDVECLEILNLDSLIDMCSTQVNDRKHLLYIDGKNIHPNIRYYFNRENPLYKHLNINPEYIFYHKSPFPNQPINIDYIRFDINHEFYYNLVGLNNNVRLNYFDYKRNIENEIEFKNEILSKNGLKPKSKYNIINDPILSHKYKTNNTIKEYIKNSYPVINISDITNCIGQATSLIESAESLHLIENNNVNFIYHMQYKNLLKYKKNIYFHIWLRDRNWLWAKDFKFDSAWKMMSDPKLSNWNFIFSEEAANLIKK